MKSLELMSASTKVQVDQLIEMASRNYFLNEEKILAAMQQIRAIGISRNAVLPTAVYSEIKIASQGVAVLSLLNESLLSFLDVSDNPEIKLANDALPNALGRLFCKGESFCKLSLAKSKLIYMDISSNSRLELVENVLPPFLETLIAQGDSVKTLNLKEHRNLRFLDISDNAGVILSQNMLPAGIVTLKASGNSCKQIDFTGVKSIRSINISNNHKCILSNIVLSSIDLIDCSGLSCGQLNISKIRNVKALNASENTTLDEIWLPNKIQSADFTGCSNLQLIYGSCKIKAENPKDFIKELAETQIHQSHSKAQQCTQNIGTFGQPEMADNIFCREL